MKRLLKPLNKYTKKLEQDAIDQIQDWLAGRSAPTYKKISSPPADKDEAKAARKAVGLSQVRFAEALGISPMTVQSWERDVRTPGGLESKILRLVTIKPERLAEIMTL